MKYFRVGSSEAQTESFELPTGQVEGYRVYTKDTLIECDDVGELWTVEAEVFETPSYSDYTHFAAKQCKNVERISFSVHDMRLFLADCIERLLTSCEQSCVSHILAKIASVREGIPYSDTKTSSDYFTAEVLTAVELMVECENLIDVSVALDCLFDAMEEKERPKDAAIYWVPNAYKERNWQVNRLLTHYLKLNPDEFAGEPS